MRHAGRRFLGSRLDLRAFESGKPPAPHPLTIEVGERGVAVLFRFGAVALVNVSAVEEATFFTSLQPFVVDPVEHPEEEELEARSSLRAPRPRRCAPSLIPLD